MDIPTVIEAERLLEEADFMNPGDWVAHNRVAAICAGKIALKCKELDEDKAYVLGLLHDIGRRYGVCDLQHILNGYSFMLEKGYSTSARICLTHSFPLKDINAYNGQNDCSPEDSLFIQNYINDTGYDDYDRLIQICDAISYPTGPCIIEKRLVDVVMRRGFNDLTILKWKEFFKLKQHFEEKMKCSLYEIFEIKN